MTENEIFIISVFLVITFGLASITLLLTGFLLLKLYALLYVRDKFEKRYRDNIEKWEAEIDQKRDK